VFTAAVWFKTRTNRGGKILGFGSSNTRRSPTPGSDRHVYMTDDGRLIFGLYSVSGRRTIATTGSYNDGAWHHVAVSNGASGVRMYIDGTLAVRSLQTFNPANYVGFWQLGGDSLPGWVSAPTSLDFAGSVDEFAVYPRELDAATIDAQYSLAMSTS
jgi:hypothetical protein